MKQSLTFFLCNLFCLGAFCQNSNSKDLYKVPDSIAAIGFYAEVKIAESNYADAYLSLADQMEGKAGSFSGFVWDQGAREFLVSTAANMRAWVDTVRKIG